MESVEPLTWTRLETKINYEHICVLHREVPFPIQLVIVESKSDRRCTAWMDALGTAGMLYANEFRDVEIAKTVLLQKARKYFQELADDCANLLLDELTKKEKK